MPRAPIGPAPRPFVTARYCTCQHRDLVHQLEAGARTGPCTGLAADGGPCLCPQFSPLTRRKT